MTFVRKILYCSSLVSIFLIIFLARKPVLGGNYLTLAALKDIAKSSPINSFSKLQMMQSFLSVDLAERLMGRDQVKKCYVGKYAFAVQDAVIAKNLLIDVFIRQDYYFPYQGSNLHIIDCGANVGFSTAYFKLRYPNSTILAFEPDPKNFSLLSNNIAKAGFKDVVLYKKALAAEEGELSFGGNATTASFLSNQSISSDLIKVQAVRLSSFITKPVDILKMDIEGAESQVLKELDLSNKIKLVKNIIMEFHYTAQNTNVLGEVLSMFERRNFKYQIKSVSGMTQDFNADEKNREKMNCLMIYAYQA